MFCVICKIRSDAFTPSLPPLDLPTTSPSLEQKRKVPATHGMKKVYKERRKKVETQRTWGDQGKLLTWKSFYNFDCTMFGFKYTSRTGQCTVHWVDILIDVYFSCQYILCNSNEVFTSLLIEQISTFWTNLFKIHNQQHEKSGFGSRAWFNNMYWNFKPSNL